MSVAFWSVEVGKGKEKTVQPPEGFVLNVTQLALADASKGKSYVVKVKTVSVDGDDIVAVIATLKPGTEQVSVNLVFGFDVPVTFIVDADGPGTVHLSGYYQPGPDMDDEEDEDYMGMGDEEDDSEEEEDSEEDDEDDDMDQEEKIKGAEAAIAKLGAAKKDSLLVTGKSALTQLKGGKNQQKMVVESDDDSEEDNDSEEDSEGDDVDEAFVKKMIERNNLNDTNGSDSESDNDDSDDGSDEEPPMKVSKGTPKGIVTASGNKHHHSTPKGAKSAPPNTPATAPGKKGNKPKTPMTNPGSNKKGNQHNQKSGDKRKR